MKALSLCLALFTGILIQPARADRSSAPVALDPELPVSLYWLAPDHDYLSALTTGPEERLALDPAGEEALVLGHLAYRYSGTLGKSGTQDRLTCHACHGNGASPGFFAPGISDRPGTADVSSSRFYKWTRDSSFDPLPVPDLLDARNGDLDTYLTRLIDAKFDGTARYWLAEGLAAYIRAMEPAGPERPVSIEDDLTWLDLYVWRLSMVRGDPEEHRFIAAAIREHIREISKRFDGPEHSSIRALFTYWDELLAQPPGGFGANVAILGETLDDTRTMIIEAAATSLYKETPARFFLNARGLLK